MNSHNNIKNNTENHNNNNSEDTKNGNDSNDKTKIVTRHGCICKNEYMAHGKKIKNKCTKLGDFNNWCVVEGDCGATELLTEGRKDNWDYCNRDRSSLFNPKWTYGERYFHKQMIGSLIYLVIFVLFVPYMLYKYKLYNFLSVYMPNFDLIAAAITYNGGPYTWEIFNELYSSEADNVYSYISSVSINFLSLLGVVYLVSRVVKNSRSVIKGCIIGLVMIIVTYLIPNDIIISVQNYAAGNIIKYTNLSPNTSLLLYLIITFIGLIIATLFIIIEEYIIIGHDETIVKIAKWISKRIFNKSIY